MLRIRRSRNAALLVLTTLLALSLGVSGQGLAVIHDSGSGSIDPSTPEVTWAGPVKTAATPYTETNDLMCDEPEPAFCDDFTVNVNVAPSYWETHAGGVLFEIDWTNPANDFDLYVYQNGTEVDHDAEFGNVAHEQVFVEKASGAYLVRVVYFTVVEEGYAGTATLQSEVVEGGGGAIFADTEVKFAPATMVSAHWLGSEPQTTLERPEPETVRGALSPGRIFVDWPLSSRSNIGQVSRSLDGGDSFRLLIDHTCAVRSRPNCLTGGGGDTETDVNRVSGTLLFADQEVLAQEALAVSYDHGDTFPVQYAVSNTATAVDRQWLAATDNSAEFQVGPATIEGFLAYHIPLAGQYIQGIDQNGALLPQPVAQIQQVSQSGQLRVDTSGGPGHGWIYQPYRDVDGNNFVVGTAFAQDYVSPTAWEVNPVTEDQPTIFPWLALDNHGNAYGVWVTGGKMYYSFSPIDDRANNPDLGGRPGTFWSPQVEVNLPSVTSAVFPEVIAGDPGRIGITYVGSTECVGSSNDCLEDPLWDVYGAVITDALQEEGPAVVHTGVVSHRHNHEGNICTSGTACLTTGRDRSLLDMIDVGSDKFGRIGIVFTDNYSTFQNTGKDPATAEEAGGEDEGPFVHFAKIVKGPSLYEGITVTEPTELYEAPGGIYVGDPRGDAFWPNKKFSEKALNLRALDIRSTYLWQRNGFLVGKIRLVDNTKQGMIRDLAAYNAVTTTDLPAERIQYVLRFSTGTEIYHLSMESLADGERRFFGGMLDENDRVINPINSATTIAAYNTDAGFNVTGKTRENNLIFRIPLSDLGFTPPIDVFSISAYAMAGPLEEGQECFGAGCTSMRTVDASRPYDKQL